MSKEMRNLKIEEIEKLISDKQVEISEFTKKVSKGSEKNVKKISFLRKDLARMLTIKRELQIIKEVGEL